MYVYNDSVFSEFFHTKYVGEKYGGCTALGANFFFLKEETKKCTIILLCYPGVSLMLFLC